MIILSETLVAYIFGTGPEESSLTRNNKTFERENFCGFRGFSISRESFSNSYMKAAFVLI